MNVTDFDLIQITRKTSDHFSGQPLRDQVSSWFSLWAEFSKDFPTFNLGQDDDEWA